MSVAAPRSARWFESLLWDLYEAYGLGPTLVPDGADGDGWPAWRELFISKEESDRLRQLTKDRLMAAPYGLPEGAADGMLQTVYWINEHFVYSERELAEYIEEEGGRLAERWSGSGDRP